MLVVFLRYSPCRSNMVDVDGLNDSQGRWVPVVLFLELFSYYLEDKRTDQHVRLVRCFLKCRNACKASIDHNVTIRC